MVSTVLPRLIKLGNRSICRCRLLAEATVVEVVERRVTGCGLVVIVVVVGWLIGSDGWWWRR